MRVQGCCVALTFLLTTLSISCLNYYDASTCGLPGANYVKPKPKREALSEGNSSTSAETIAENSDYESDYVESTNGEMEENTEDNNENDPMRRKVMGGERVLMGEMPWSVLIQASNGRVCGGTLISKRHVITAAHCFWKNTDNRECTTDDMYGIEEALNIMKVSVGGICRLVDEEHQCSEAELGKWIRIESAFYTPFFEHRCSGTKDIALLKLAESVSDDIHHICLPHLHDTDELYDSFARLFSFGYGSDPLNDFADAATPFLQKVELGVKMTDAECDENLDFRKPDTFCTFERAERNVCHGDSGGGVTTSLEGRHYLVGLVSFGTSCTDLAMGSRAEAQVHTDLAYYTADIDEFLNMKVEDRKERWEKSKSS